jgi:Rrf2 family cysteine metabolism transcriptional repressor
MEVTVLVSQKSRYALRAILELALRYGRGPVKVSEIAEAQAIPIRFLEIILNQLKQGGFVESRRGNVGGYILSRHPSKLTVGDVMSFMQGAVNMANCVDGNNEDKCRLFGMCVFLPMWEKVKVAISQVYDNTTFQDLVNQQRQKVANSLPC